MIDRGTQARVLLDSPVYQSAVNDLIAGWTAAILGSDFENTVEREQMFRLIHAQRMVQAELESRVMIADRILLDISEREREELERG